MTRFVGTPLRGIEFSSVSDEAVSARVVNDAHARIRIDAGGRITWSSGTASGDVTLYRDGANHLKTDDLLQATGGLVTLTSNGVPQESLPNGSIAVDVTNDVFYFRSNGEWLEVSSGANVTIQATEPLDAESGDLWFDSDTLVLYILNGASWVSVSGSLTLAELDDVNIASVQEGDILSYDGTSWVPSLGNNSKYAIASVIGDGTTTEFSIVHNFGSRDVLVIARNNASPYENIEIGWESTDSNTVGIIFSDPPAVDGVRINVLYTGATTLSGTYSTTIGDGTSLQYLLSHNLNTRDINVVCREASSPYGVIDIAWEATTVDTATVYFSESPALNDVRVTVYSSHVLFGGSSGGGGGASSLDELSDVAITSAANGQVLTYNGTSWVNQSPAATIDSLDDISDVNVASAASGDFLKFDGTNWVPQDGIATETYVDTAISNLVDVAPVALDTLNELAAALGDDENFATTVTNALADKAPLASPGLTGTPTAPTAVYGTDTTQIATTEFVQDAIDGFASDLNGLSDVVITAPEEFQGLSYDGTNWVNSHIPLVSYVRNAESTTITTGTCVYIFGATGDHATVKRADNNSDTTSSKTIGVAAANITASNNGPIVTRGYVDGINLSTGYAAGDVLWLGENGAFTKTKPTAPDHLVFIGVVVRATVNGIIYVATQNGYELDELHDVSINGKTSGDVLKYNGSLWVNSQLAINDLSDVNTSGQSFNGAGGTLLYYNGTNWVVTENGPNGLYTSPYSLQVSESISGGSRYSSIESSGISVYYGDSGGAYSTSIGVSGIEVYENGNPIADFDSAKLMFISGSNYVSIKKPTTITGTNEITIPNATGTIALLGSIALGTDTTGNYVSDVNAGTGVSVTHTPGEGSSPTIAIGQAVGTTDNPTFAGITADGVRIGITTANEIDTSSGNLTLDSASGTVIVDDNLRINNGAIQIMNSGGSQTLHMGGTSITGTGAVTIQTSSTPNGYINLMDEVGIYSSKSLVFYNVSTGNKITLAQSTVGSNIVVTLPSSSGTIAIGQPVGTTDNVQFNDVTVSGNLTVNGTTTTLNTTELLVEDNIITLNYGAISPSNNAGIEVNRGLANFKPAIRWNEMSDKWEFTNDGTAYTAIGGSVMSSSSNAALITMDIGV